MRRLLAISLVGLIAVSFLTACSQSRVRPAGAEAPLFSGMGQYQMMVATQHAWARRYFDQGLTLAYAFNHAEAERSFRQAATFDPQFAMAYWGMALVLGPNINAPMDPEKAKEAWRAIEKARGLATSANPVEQALIEALAKRYPENAVPEKRKIYDENYASAMRQVWERFPAHDDVGTLFAESIMDLHPWDYWKLDGKPQPWTKEFVGILENVLQRNPNHPGANHLYIHAVEASTNPEKGLASAARLEQLVPGAGHLVHMPGHIYIRTGDYQKAVVVNQRAMEIDDQYLSQCRAQGVYPLAYVPHNAHFLWAAAILDGQRALARSAGNSVVSRVATDQMGNCGMGTLQHYYVIPLYTHVRFGDWADVLSYPKPAAHLLYPQGVWHYARGLAFTAQDNLPQAKREFASLQTIIGNPEITKVTIWDVNPTRTLLQIAGNILQSEIAYREQKPKLAIAALRQAVTQEDSLRYNEPPDWFFPVRQNLGAMLLKTGNPSEAEAVYRQDLERFPKNGWSLHGLAQSLRAQGMETDAVAVERDFQHAWQRSDFKLPQATVALGR